MLTLLLKGLAALFALAAAIPARTGGLYSHPRPLRDYGAALAWVDSVQRAERAAVDSGAGTIVLTHGERTARAVVLVHGLTSTPSQFRELGEALYADGYNVLIPRLPHHGQRDRNVGELRALTAEELRALGDVSVDVARGLGDSVDVLGLSAGGTVAAWIAEHRPDARRVVVVAPAIGLHGVPSFLRAPLVNFVERVPNVTVHKAPDETPAPVYSGFATRGVAETLLLGEVTLHAAGRAPMAARSAVVVLNANDETVDNGLGAELARRWARRRGDAVDTYVFDKGLGLEHNLIDPWKPCARPDVVYPVLLALVEQRPLPPIDVPTIAREGCGAARVAASAGR